MADTRHDEQATGRPVEVAEGHVKRAGCAAVAAAVPPERVVKSVAATVTAQEADVLARWSFHADSAELTAPVGSRRGRPHFALMHLAVAAVLIPGMGGKSPGAGVGTAGG